MSRMIPERIVEEIRTRTSIVEVIGSRVPLKRAGGLYKACCPFHQEKTPSFTVNPSRESYKCFGCGEGGDVFSFLMKHDGMSFSDAVRMLGDRCGVEVVFDEDGGNAHVVKRLLALHTEIAAFYQRCLKQTKAGAVAREYLQKRALDEETQARFRIGFAPNQPCVLEQFAAKAGYTLEEMVAAGLGTFRERVYAGQSTLHDRFAGRLMFPISDTQGRVIAFSGRVLSAEQSPAKYVNSPETEIFKKSRVLYGLEQAQRKIVASPHREAILCEGQIDVIRCHACGFERAVASQGTAFTEEHANLLKRYADSAVLLFDGDGAGRKAAIRTGAILLATGIPVRVATLGAGEDPDSFLRTHDAADFEALLSAAVGLIPFHIQYLKEQEEAPTSEGALGRIVAGVLPTIAGCRNEVHKARMLQETAELLALPEAALWSELEGVEEVLRHRAASQERREAAREGNRAGQGDGMETLPYAEPMVMVEPSETLTLQIEGAGGGATGKPVALPDKLELSICELWVHHFEEEGVANLLRTRLPAWLIQSEVCRHLVEAYEHVTEQGGEGDVIDALQGDATAQALVQSLLVRPDRAGVHENSQAVDLAKDLILTIWRRWCNERRTALGASDANASMEAASEDSVMRMRRRMELARCEQQLKQWQTGEAAIQLLMGERSEPTDPTAVAPVNVQLEPVASKEVDVTTPETRVAGAYEEPQKESPPEEMDEGAWQGNEAIADYLALLDEDDPGPS